MTRTALITGGSRGIGHACVQLFASHGWNVALCSRDGAAAAKAGENITKATQNKNILGIAADTGDARAVEQLFEQVMGRFSSLDVLVNNAAVLHTGDAFELSDGDFDDMLRVNVTGVMQCCRQAFRHMKKHGGSIVNISSLAGIQGTDKIPGLWGYTASKFAVVGLTEGLAVEGKPYHIRVNCVAPGATDTDMLRQAAPDFKARAKPVDIARVVYYLADAEQSGILTGSTVPVFCND